MSDEVKMLDERILDIPWMYVKLSSGDQVKPEWNARVLTNHAMPITAAFQFLPLELAMRIVSDHNETILTAELTKNQWERREIETRMRKYKKTYLVARSLGMSLRTIQSRLIGYKRLKR